MRSRVVLLAQCGMLGILGGCGAFTGSPQHYTSPDGRFSVQFPGTPKAQVKQRPTAFGNLESHFIIAEDRKRNAYGACFSDYPPGVVQPENLEATLDAVAYGIVMQPGAILREKNAITVAGRPGREIRYELTSPERRDPDIGVARVFLVGDRSYQLVVVGHAAGFSAERQKAFFESFQVNGEAPPASVATAPEAPPVEAPPLPPGPDPAPAPVAAPAPPVAETPAPPTVAGTPAPPPTPPSSSGQSIVWGSPVDPSGDCRIQTQGTSATIEVPGSIHNLIGPSGKTNAPRILSAVQGDFVAEVTVLKNVLPNAPGARGVNVPFHAAGLLLWGGVTDFIRLERAAAIRGGMPRRSISLKHFRVGKPAVTHEGKDPGGPITVRLERRRNQVTASFKGAASGWQALPTVDFSPSQAQVGVAAVNTASEPFVAGFEDWRLSDLGTATPGEQTLGAPSRKGEADRDDDRPSLSPGLRQGGQPLPGTDPHRATGSPRPR